MSESHVSPMNDPYHDDALPGLVPCGKGDRSESVRPGFATRVGRGHPGGENQGCEDQAAFRTVGLGALSDSAPQGHRPPVRLSLLGPPLLFLGTSSAMVASPKKSCRASAKTNLPISPGMRRFRFRRLSRNKPGCPILPRLCVQSHDILYRVSQEHPLHSARPRSSGREERCLGRRWMYRSSGCGLWWRRIGERKRWQSCAGSSGSRGRWARSG